MSNVLVNEASLQNVASAIRTKNETQNTYTPSQMAQAILDLPSGGTLIEKTVTVEGTYLAEDDNADGYSKVINNIPWRITPYAFDLHPNGYVMSGKWQVNGSTVNYSDIYIIKANHRYFLTLGDTKGSRWRGITLTQDPTPMDKEITATATVMNVSSPAARANVTFTSTINGYLAVTKDNAGVSGIPTYLFDITKG